jgi:nitrile hydratase
MVAIDERRVLRLKRGLYTTRNYPPLRAGSILINGVHDVGGMHGFGTVQREENEYPFHAAWEGSIHAIVEAALAQRLFNLDEFRHAIERMDPAHYLASPYYEHWLAAVETNLVEKGLLSRAEINSRVALIQERPDYALPRADDPDLTTRILTSGGRAKKSRGSEPTPRFHVGDYVVARNVHARGHTRLPRYVRGKRGQINRVHGIATFPDSNAHGHGKQPQAVYSVRFDGRELWGESAEACESLYIDLWESYLDPS